MNRKRFAFRRVRTVFMISFAIATLLILGLTLMLYISEKKVYASGLVFALSAAIAFLLLFIPALREKSFFREHGAGELIAREVKNPEVFFSTFFRHNGFRAFRVRGKITNLAGEEIPVVSPLYAVNKHMARNYAYRRGNFLEGVRFVAYTSPSLSSERYYVRPEHCEELGVTK